MRYLSLCSGIEAATVAWRSLGWQPVAFAEIEPFPCAVLKHHYPEIPNLGDITRIDGSRYRGAVDLVVGGTPCQDFSIAGQRAGLAGERGGLALVFTQILSVVRPEWVVWENVPGVFSTNGGRDFGAFLRALDDIGYSCAWRVLDAQFFGVPQRRRRVYIGCRPCRYRLCRLDWLACVARGIGVVGAGHAFTGIITHVAGEGCFYMPQMRACR